MSFIKLALLSTFTIQMVALTQYLHAWRWCFVLIVHAHMERTEQLTWMPSKANERLGESFA